MGKSGFTRTISTAEIDGTPRLILEQPTGDVRIEGWDRPEIEISISDDRELFDVSIEGSQVRVRNVAPKPAPDNRATWEAYKSELESSLGDIGANISRVASRVERQVERAMRKVERGMRGVNIDVGRWSGGRDYTIKVPHTCDLSLRTSSGDLRIERVSGTHFLQSSSGDLTLDRVEGAVLATSASGDLNFVDVKGKLGVRSTSGDINIDLGQLSEVSVTTVSGDLTLDLRTQPEREFEIKTVSGDARLRLPHDSHLTIEVNTLSGDIISHFRGETQIERRRPGKYGKLELNGGGLMGRIHTVSGDVILDPVGGYDRDHDRDESEGQGTVNLSREGRQPENRDVEAERRREAERTILHALERGELNVEEAMRRLAEL
jgi:hypothetical protein